MIANPLPALCVCGARVYLFSPYGWTDRDGRAHRCSGGK